MATAKMLRTQALFYVIAISLQIASGQRDRYNYRGENTENNKPLLLDTSTDTKVHCNPFVGGKYVNYVLKCVIGI